MASRAPITSGSGHLDPKRPIRLLIVDDSAVVRAVFTRMIEPRRAFEIAACVASADAALAFLSGTQVDIILLDIEMPGMDGLTALPALLSASRGARVLIVSSACDAGATATMRALTLGAADTLAKPGAGSFGGRFADVLAERLAKIGHARPPSRAPGERAFDEPDYHVRPLSSAPIACLAIGASTGGLHALADMLRAMPPSFDAPILITQHLPAGFMPFFAAQIAEISGRPTAVAADGMRIDRGRIVVAPGDGHLSVAQGHSRAIARITDERVQSGCMPSVDPMLYSLGEVYGPAAVGVVLTGMGRDGTCGAAHLAASGGDIIAQNRESSVVWGMPGSVTLAGLASAILPPIKIADLLVRRGAAC